MGSPEVSSTGAGAAIAERFSIRGMTCGSCVRRVEATLGGVPGVRSARVDLATATATVLHDPDAASIDALRQAVAQAGYALDVVAPEAQQVERSSRPVVVGLLGALALVGLYLGTITLAQGWGHAVQQLLEDRWFVSAIVAGFGTQLGLFTYLRGLHARAPVGGVAASTGTSGVAMLACCAHHVTEILPILGLSGAAVFLNAYKAELLWLGITMNLAGVVYLTWRIWQQRGPGSCRR